MALTAGAKYDVFLSYSHVDNERADGSGRGGWVDVLHDELVVQLRKRLGPGVVFYFDRERRSNKPLTPELMEAACGSALLLIVLSPSYLASEWCARERNAFLQVARDLGDDRVFVVRSMEVDQGRVPAELVDNMGLPFFVFDREIQAPRTLGEHDPKEPAFISMVYKLREEIAVQLDELRASPPARLSASAPSPSGGRVFLARATDDLEEREERLRGCLTQAGGGLQPRRSYFQQSVEEFDAAVTADLAGARLFVQLLSGARGPELPFGGPLRLPALLNARAAKAGLKILAWRDRGLDLSAVADSVQRDLLDGAIACPLEEFERRVLEELRREPPVERPRSQSTTVYIARDPSDRALADEVVAALKAAGVTSFLPLDKGPPEAIRRDLEGTLSDADGVLVIYGASDPYWVREQVRFGNKVFTRREHRPTLGIYQGPPPDKSELNLVDPNMLLLDCSAGFHADRLQPFLDRLHP